MTISKEILEELHLERVPEPRYDVPIPRSPEEVQASVNHRKAVACVDPLETAAFERFIPDGVVIDQTIDSRSFAPGCTFAVCVPTERPAPVNEKITAATGITNEINRQNHFLELAIWIKRAYDEYGATGMSAPLVFRTEGGPDALGRPTQAMIGAICVFDRKVENMNDVGLVAPKSDITPDPEGLVSALSTTQ